MAFCLMWWPASTVVRRHHSSITNWAARMFRERHDLESPNFLRTSTPTYSTPHRVWRRHRSAFVEVRKKNRSKMSPPTKLGRILVARRFAWPNQLGFLFSVIYGLYISYCEQVENFAKVQMGYHSQETSRFAKPHQLVGLLLLTDPANVVQVGHRRRHVT